MFSWLRDLSHRAGARPIYLALLSLTLAIALFGWLIPQAIRGYRHESARRALAAELVTLAVEAPLLAATEDISELAMQDTAQSFGKPPDELSRGWTLVWEGRRLLGVAGDEPREALVEDIKETARRRAEQPPAGAIAGFSPQDQAKLEALKLCFYAMSTAQGELMAALSMAGSKPEETADLERLAYACCALGDVVLDLELGTSLLGDMLVARRNMLVTLRSLHKAPAHESALGATLDGLILEANRGLVILEAGASREPDPVLDSLRDSSDPVVRAGAFVRMWQEHDERIREALGGWQPAAPRLRRALLAAGRPDPQGGMGAYLEATAQRLWQVGPVPWNENGYPNGFGSPPMPGATGAMAGPYGGPPPTRPQ